MEGGEAVVTGSSGSAALGVRSAQGQGGTEDQGLGSEGEGHLMKSRNAQISVDTRPSRLLLSALVPKSKSLRGCGGRARVPEPIKGRLPLTGRSGHSGVLCLDPPAAKLPLAWPLFLSVQVPLWQSGPACH